MERDRARSLTEGFAKQRKTGGAKTLAQMKHPGGTPACPGEWITLMGRADLDQPVGAWPPQDNCALRRQVASNSADNLAIAVGWLANTA